MLASDSDEIERSAVRRICLATPEPWPTRTGTHAVVAQNLQLHPATAVHGLPMEDAADRKECQRSPRNPLHADLSGDAALAGQRLYRQDICRLGAQASSGP